MDPRIARTQASLQQALLELAQERPFAEITVGDIAERAGVNRSSFYQHYADKETLLADALDAIVEEVGLSVPPQLEAHPPAVLVGFLQHVAEHAELYRWAVGGHGSAVVLDRLRVRIEDLVRHHVDAAGKSTPFDGIPVDLVAAGIAGSGLGAIRAWLEREPMDPVDVASEWIWRLLIAPLPKEEG